MEDHYGRSGDEEDLGKNGTTVAELKTKGAACASVPRHFGATRNWTQLAEKSCYWRWVMDLWVRSTHQTAEPWMEERIVTKTQKGEGVHVQNQGDADRFFWCPWNCPRRIFAHEAKLLISTSTKTYCDVWCAQGGEENCGKRGHGCFIMTMLQLIMPWEFGSFLPKITLLYWSNHPTLQISPFVTSFCFPNTRKSSKELVFKIQKPVKQPWWERSERSRRNPSRSTWKRGRGDWKRVFEPKEITLKATCCKIY